MSRQLGMTSTRQNNATKLSRHFRSAISKKEFLQLQTLSVLKKPKTTFGTVNFDYIENHDPTFRKPNAGTRACNAPWLT